MMYLAWSCVLLLSAYLLWVRLDGSRPWWLAALSPVAFWAFMPVLVLLPLGLWVRAPLYLGAAALATGLYAGHFLWPLIPWQRRRPRPEERPIRLMTANLLKTNGHAQAIAQTILAAAPDVVALQELRPQHARALKRLLAEAYPYQALAPAGGSRGMGLLSRHPLLAVELRQLAPRANPTQVARLRLDGHETWLVNAHPRIAFPRFRRFLGLRLPCGFETRFRREDMVALAQLLAALPGDALLLGDLNTTDQCQEYRLLPRHWRDAFRQVGWGAGFTYPVGAPLFGLRPPWPILRLDYIFCAGAWRPLRARLGRMPGSDHRYVLVEAIHTRPNVPYQR
jgi:vancomycin resistance protein VanJ